MRYMERSLLDRAVRLSTKGHEGQSRKGEEMPYITHPVMVAFILARYGFPEVVLAAALAHDLVEDTAITEEEVRVELGDTVAGIVCEVTHDDSLGWKEKKLAYIENVRTASVEAKAVSIADKIHNAESLLARYAEKGPALWADFNAGREDKLWFEEAMLSMLKESWDHPLIDEYARLVAQMRALV